MRSCHSLLIDRHGQHYPSRLAGCTLCSSSARTATDARTATGALDEFTKLNAEIVSLSRRNSNVRSLAISLGRKRTLAAVCDDHLRQLNDALASHAFAGTR